MDKEMKRFEPDRYYRPTDPELAVIAMPGTLRQWRYQGRGPRYYKSGNRVLYLGRDLNEWLDRHMIDPTNPE